MIEERRSSETSILTSSTRRYIPEDCILHSDRRENLKCYNVDASLAFRKSIPSNGAFLVTVSECSPLTIHIGSSLLVCLKGPETDENTNSASCVSFSMLVVMRLVSFFPVVLSGTLKPSVTRDDYGSCRHPVRRIAAGWFSASFMICIIDGAAFLTCSAFREFIA
jgi:hypothetical protein